jgi:hypothetical protein
MTKKILLGLFILLMGVVAIVAYSFYKNVKQPINKTTFEAIPQNAALIIKESSFNELFTKLVTTNLMWEELTSNTETTNSIHQQIHYLDSLLTGPFQPLFKDKTLLGSLHLSGANDYDFIYYISLNSNVTEDKLVQRIKNVTKKNTTTRTYDGVNIFTLPTNTTKKVSLVIYKNTLAFSYSTILIEDVIRQLNSETSLINNPQFAQLTTNSGLAEDGNLFINTPYFSKIINQYLNKSTKEYCSPFENYTGWTELDISIKPNSLSLNGFSFSDPKDNHSLTLFKDQKPEKLAILSVIPYNTALLYNYGLSDSKLYFENRKLSLKSTNQFFKYQKYLDDLTERFGIDLEEEVLNNIGNEVAFVITESQNNDFTNNRFILFHTLDIEKTKSDLASISEKTTAITLENKPLFDPEIGKLEIKNLFKHLLGKPFVNLENHYYTFIEDYVIFGNSAIGLKNYLKNINQERTLSNNDNFQSFNENLSSSSNLFIYNNISRSTALYQQYCKKEYLPIIDEKIDVFRKFEAVAIQVNTEKNGMYYNNIHLKYNPIYKKETSSLWELVLDTTTNNAPQLLVNHKTKAKEIFIQDDAHKIYLISNIGKVIWTKQLQENIIGKVHQIDVYKNNKLQLLFNTSSKIYLLDRNGNNVEKYPVKLSSKATNTITPLDYSKNKNYRMLIGCENNMVYNYNVHGDLVKGWEYSTTESPANGKIWHFTISNKDYIVIPLQNGSLKIIERNGKDRVILKNTLPQINNSTYLNVGTDLSKTYLITTDSSGIVTKLYLNDQLEKITFENGQENTSFNFFDYDNNQSNDFILSHNNTLRIIDIEKNILYENEFELNITQQPQHFKMKDKTSRTGIVTQNEIYLINAKREIEDGFPLAGSTPFSIADINNDKTINLVVINGNILYTYNLK